MPRLLVHGFTISLAGFGAGRQQSLEAPLGIGGEALHDWMLCERSFRRTTTAAMRETSSTKQCLALS